VKKAEN
jgi:hypothetical protein